MIDFHTHILPRMDDGAKNTAQSLEMLKLCAAQNIEKVIATPHFYATHKSPYEFLTKREKSYNMLMLATSEKQLPEVILGAEVLYFEGISDCKELEMLKIGDTRLVLIEMPFVPWTSRMIYEVADIYEKRNLIPLIAHIDRYIDIFGKKNVVNSFDELPVLIQLNSNFLISRKTSRFAISLIKKGKVHLLGSDFHNLTTRKPNLKEAFDIIEKKLGKDYVMRISDCENAVFQNDNEKLLSYALN